MERLFKKYLFFYYYYLCFCIFWGLTGILAYAMDQDEALKLKLTSPNACDLKPETPLQLPTLPVEDWKPDNLECKSWLKAVEMYCGPDAHKTAENLLYSTQFENSKHIFYYLRNAANEALKSIPPNEPIVVITESDNLGNNKSSAWFADVLLNNKHNLAQFPNLSGRFKIEDQRNIPDLLSAKPNAYKYFFLFDDAIYSGEQISSIVQQLKTAGFSEKHLYIFALRTTNVGANRIQENGRIQKSGENKVDIQLYANLMPTLMEQDPDLAVRLSKMYGPGYKEQTMPSIFFSHIVPDFVSGIKPFLRHGYVQCKPREKGPTGIKTGGPLKCEGQKMEFECIPWIKPPYKQKPHPTTDYINKAGLCRKEPNAPKCPEFRHARDAFLKGTCRDQAPYFKRAKL